MNDSTGMILRARTILPVSQPPLKWRGGHFWKSHSRGGFLAGLRPHANGNLSDLGEVILLPGLINAIATSTIPTWPECCHRQKPSRLDFAHPFRKSGWVIPTTRVPG